MSALTDALDAVLAAVTTGSPRVPGVVAVATDRAGNTYEGTAGERSLGGGGPMTTDSVFAIFSTTKAIGGTACLQLVEEGLLDLDAPARTYVPELGDVEVLEGFDDQGRPRLRAPKRDITTRMLLTHTAGFGYDFFNESYLRMATEHGQPSVVTATKASITTPLLFDPGERWEYGCNIDWAGQVVEAITGKLKVTRPALFISERPKSSSTKRRSLDSQINCQKRNCMPPRLWEWWSEQPYL